MTSPVWLTSWPLLQDPGTGSRVSIDLSAYSRHARGRDVLAPREEPLVVTAAQRVPPGHDSRRGPGRVAAQPLHRPVSHSETPRSLLP